MAVKKIDFFGTAFRRLKALADKDKIILEQARKNNSIIYGGRSIQKQLGRMKARPTKDWDIFSNKPKQSANKLQGKLDKISGGNYYYASPSKYHKGTHKVYEIGRDNMPKTRDDRGIVDYTKSHPKIKTVFLDGVSYIHLDEVKKDKIASLKDKQFYFRHKKDREDLERIKNYQYRKKHPLLRLFT